MDRDLDLDALRRRIRNLDALIQDLVGERLEIARRAGLAKRERGLPVRDLAVERQVVARYREAFEEDGLPELGELLAALVIRHSVMVQEDLPAPTGGDAGTVLLVGGAGRMGRWFARFFTDLGWRVLVHDVAPTEDGLTSVDDPVAAAADVDLVLLTVPPAATGDWLERLRGVAPVVADIGSIKAPFRDRLRELAATQPVGSIHPMWGPDTRLLSGKNLLVVDCGHAAATAYLKKVFEPTAARLHEVGLDDHDRLMAAALNLPHLLSLAFGRALANRGVPSELLVHLGGPTFTKQARVAAEVANENAELYRQIQGLNPHGEEVATALTEAIAAVRTAVADPEAFADLMADEAKALEPFATWWPF